MTALLKYWKLFAVAGALAGAAYGGWWVRDAQATKELAQSQTEILIAITDQRLAERELRAAEDAARLLSRELEDQANAQPATGICLPIERVLRLNLR